MTKKLQAISQRYPDHVAAALAQEAEIEVTEMKRRCPVDVTEDAPHPGNLRASIHAEAPSRRGYAIVVIVAMGTQAPYAIYVHEDPDAIHKIGEWKFMESVIRESAPHMGERIARRLRASQSAAARGLG